jgi:hypothetical protein
MPEEPGAVIPHAGILRGGRRATGGSTSIPFNQLGAEVMVIVLNEVSLPLPSPDQASMAFKQEEWLMGLFGASSCSNHKVSRSNLSRHYDGVHLSFVPQARGWPWVEFASPSAKTIFCGLDLFSTFTSPSFYQYIHTCITE